MLFARYGTFTGGIDLPDEKRRTLGKPIQAPRPLERLLVPLAVPGYALAAPVVEVGRRVQAGARIASCDDRRGVDVFAPLSGRVASFTTAAVAGAMGFVRVPAVELTDLSAPPQLEAPPELSDGHTYDDEAGRQRIGRAALLTHRRPAQPLTVWLDRARTYNCRRLIVNALENQPYVTADHRLLTEHGAAVVGGMELLARAIGADEMILAVDRRRTGDYGRLKAPARKTKISWIALPHKYPIGAEAILVKVLTRREVPMGSSVMRTGSAVIDAATCFAVYAGAGGGAPMTGRVVTVSGGRVGQAGNYFAPFGAPCGDLVDADGGPIVHGGPMVGLHCDRDAVVTAATDALLALEAVGGPKSGPCIRCGWCTDHCPARLNVAALNDHFELGMLPAARRAGAPACVECGICSYVCPAGLPLSQRVRQLKYAVRRRAAPAARSEVR